MALLTFFLRFGSGEFSQSRTMIIWSANRLVAVLALWADKTCLKGKSASTYSWKHEVLCNLLDGCIDFGPLCFITFSQHQQMTWKLHTGLYKHLLNTDYFQNASVCASIKQHIQ